MVSTHIAAEQDKIENAADEAFIRNAPEDIAFLLAEVEANHKRISRLENIRSAAKLAGRELLFLSQHLNGRMDEGALAHMESVARSTLRAAGSNVPGRLYPAKTSAVLDDVVSAATDLIVLICNDTAPLTEDSAASHVEKVADALIRLGAIRVKQ